MEPRIYRASSLGYSLERLVAPHLGYEPLPTPDWLQFKFDEGTALEPVVLAKLRTLGWEIEDRQEEVNSEGDYQIEVLLPIIPEPSVIIRGHLDAYGTMPGSDGKVVIEVKSMADKYFRDVNRLTWDAPGLLQKHKWQLSVYSLAMGLPGMLVCCSRNDTQLQHLLYMYMPEPFYGISDIARRVQEAEDHIKAGTIPEDCSDYPCPYAYLHAIEDPPEPADEELDAFLSAWKYADEQEKKFKKVKDNLRMSIMEYVGEFEKGKVKGSQGVTVSTNWVEEKVVNYVSKAHWETRVTGPRKEKGSAGEQG